MLPCIVSGQPARLQVRAHKAQAADQEPGDKAPPVAQVLGRYVGKFVVNPGLLNPAYQQDDVYGASAAAAASAGEVSVPRLKGVGLLTLEAEQCHGCLLSSARPVVVAPDAAT